MVIGHVVLFLYLTYTVLSDSALRHSIIYEAQLSTLSKTALIYKC